MRIRTSMNGLTRCAIGWSVGAHVNNVFLIQKSLEWNEIFARILKNVEVTYVYTTRV